MALDRRRMTSGYLPLRDAIDRLFEGSFISPQTLTSQMAFPTANLHVTDDDVIVEMAIPGVNPEDINISVTGDTVTVSGETKRERHDQKGHTYVEEIVEGRFQRSFVLPFSVDANKAAASFENGILKLTLPKSEAAKPRKVNVSHRGSLQSGDKTTQGADKTKQSKEQTSQGQDESRHPQTQEKTESGLQKERVPAASGNKS